MHMFAFTIDWGAIGGGTLAVLSWILVIILVLGGFVGTALPILPGTVLIFLGALAHYFLIGPPDTLEILGLSILLILVIVSYIIDFAGGAVGAKWFGASKWGAIGALVGGVAGFFFMPLGLLVGPLAGAVIGELAFAKKAIKPATKSGVGTVVGTAGGVAGKLAVAALMILWMAIDIFWFRAPF